MRLYSLGLGTASFAGVNMVGAYNYSPPTQDQVEELISTFHQLAVSSGAIAMVDSSAQYGNSEMLLGRYLRKHSDKRMDFWVATKWGLQNHPTDFCKYDYSLDHLERSLANSAALLGEIDLLYVHTNPGVSSGTFKNLLDEKCDAIQMMCDLRSQRRHGISQLGISCSTLEHLLFLWERPRLVQIFDVLQINAQMALRRPDVVSKLRGTGFNIVLNSPYRKGDMFLRRRPDGVQRIYARIARACPGAVVLTGTSNAEHLRMNARYMLPGKETTAVKFRYTSDGSKDRKIHIENALNDILKSAELRLRNTRGVTGRKTDPQDIVDVLVGSWKNRLGPKPSARERSALVQRILKFVGYDRPLEVVVTWGPRKFFARGEDNRVDLAEVLALQRLKEIDGAVRRCYAPGINYTIFYEDFEGRYIEQEPSSVFLQYGSDFGRLLDVIDGRGVFSLVRTSDWLIETGKKDEILAQLDRNYRAIKDYWHESQARGIQESERYASYRNMAALGFTGPVAQSVRDYYLDRLSRLLGPLYSFAEKEDMVIRLFACVLLHRQFAMFRMDSDLDPIKFSFLRINGGPDAIRDGRLDIRTVTADITKRNLAPWSARGYMREKKGKLLPAFCTWSEPIAEGARWISGQLELERDGKTAAVRADFLESPVSSPVSSPEPVQRIF